MSRVYMLTSYRHFMGPVSVPHVPRQHPHVGRLFPMSPGLYPHSLRLQSHVAPILQHPVSLFSGVRHSPFSLSALAPTAPRARGPTFRDLTMLTAILSPRGALRRRRSAPF